MTGLSRCTNGFFKFTGCLLIITTVLNVWVIYLIGGLPNNSPFDWTPNQWDLINFLWKPTLIDTVIGFLLAALCFRKKYFVFPVIILFFIRFLRGDIANIIQLLHDGFTYPAFKIQGILDILTFIMGLLGTALWINKVIGRLCRWLQNKRYKSIHWKK